MVNKPKLRSVKPTDSFQDYVPNTRLKTSYSNGTTHVIFETLDFIARLAALVPKQRVNLTRFHGVFAPNSQSFRYQ